MQNYNSIVFRLSIRITPSEKRVVEICVNIGSKARDYLNKRAKGEVISLLKTIVERSRFMVFRTVSTKG